MWVGQGHRKIFNKRKNLKIVFGLMNQMRLHLLSTVESLWFIVYSPFTDPQGAYILKR